MVFATIINEILDMDLTNQAAMKKVIGAITSHPYRGTFLVGNLLGTSTHENSEILKAIFCHHNAYSPDNLFVYVFGKKGGPHFVVNLIESRHGKLRHNLPFESYGIVCDIEDVPLPPVAALGIDELVRIDVTSGEEFIVRKVTVSGTDKFAHGRFFMVPNIDMNEIVMSLHRREDGYKIVDSLTFYHSDFEEDEEEEEFRRPETIETFENNILNYVNKLQKYIGNVGEVITFAEGLLQGLSVSRPYEEEGKNILEVRSPNNGKIFIIAFDHMKEGFTTSQIKVGLSSSMHNLLTHFVPDYAFNANRRSATLLAITYCNDLPSFEAIDSIHSVQYSTDSKVFKDVVQHYFDRISLMDRCRYVILKNKQLLSSRIPDLPQFVQTFVLSRKRSKDLINYQFETQH